MGYTGDPNKLTKEFIQDQLDRGNTLTGIAREFKYSRHAITKKAHGFGIYSTRTLNSKTYTGDPACLTKEFIQQQVAMGKSFSDIAREFDYSKPMVSKRARSFSVKSNTKPGPKPLNPNRGKCLYCGTPLTERSQRTNIHCNAECYSKHAREQQLAKWKSGKWTNKKLISVVRIYIIKRADEECESCGWGTMNPFSGKHVLQIHHKDGNHYNHKQENLIVLCPNCHALTNNYCSLNR